MGDLSIDVSTLSAADLDALEREVKAALRRRRPLTSWVSEVHDLWLLDTVVWEARAEEVTFMYATELAEYELTHPRPRFKDYLVGHAREREPEDRDPARARPGWEL